MDLIPCDENARRRLADSLFEVDDAGIINIKSADYVARTFPDILLDIARLLTEEATKHARNPLDPADSIRHQLKPYLMFKLLLGKCPQINSLMYAYFENSSFQPLPENLMSIELAADGTLKNYSYNLPGFNEELLKEILVCYFKYLSFNPAWFSTVWNWSELGRTLCHPNPDIRYLSACCLSIITQPSRAQHSRFMVDVLDTRSKTDNQYQILIETYIKHRHIFDNTFKPCLETKKERAEQFVKAIGYNPSGYSFCTESLTKVANVLLVKGDTPRKDIISLCENAIKNFIPVKTLFDAISQIAYSISIGKPCLIRGSCGSGKTAMLEYIAAHTNRIVPPEFIKVQIGDQVDSKMLIGSYVCTEIPGQFEWQPGPLTRAMVYGSWIIFEDIDSAPAEMAQVLHSVIENGNLSCVSCCPIKLDSPHPNFRVFFTQQSQRSSDTFHLGFGFVDKLCDIVNVPDLIDSDLEEILQRKYNFTHIAPKIIQLYRTAEQFMKNFSRDISHGRELYLRDLFRFCDRISKSNIELNSDKLATSDLEKMFLDSVECYLSFLPRDDIFTKLSGDLGQLLNIPSNEIKSLIIQRCPTLREDGDTIEIGRVTVKKPSRSNEPINRPRSSVAYTQQTLQQLESISICVRNHEPVLLVGETGVGKTCIVQHLANMMNTDLTVINLSQQSDSSDLLGNYSPVEVREVMRPLHENFEKIFRQTFNPESNKKFLIHLNNIFATAINNDQWLLYLKLVGKLCATALIETRDLSKPLLDNWTEMNERTRSLAKMIASGSELPMALSFSEGSLAKAIKNGSWILLDEINLAEPEVLQCLINILDSSFRPEIHLYESNCAAEPLKVHTNFRIFACMNPSTDIGKRDLPAFIKARFTEFFVDEVSETSDLRLIVESYVKTCLSPKQIESVVKFYREVKVRTSVLSDISGNSPVYSLRTLCRALRLCSKNVCRNIEKSLYESLKITFLQQLNENSVDQVMKLIQQIVFREKDIKSLETQPVPMPQDNHKYVSVEGFWVESSTEEPKTDEQYIITPSIKKNLQSLSRIISLGQRRLPILIQGNTSVGKTSLISYLARLTGNKCYRINNHEHTDLQEYVGQYVLKENGALVFQEGLLTRALKKGYWIILDELNLAPSELLEALNRVLDDNRELYIPETGETIKAHSKFMLFATQNPPEEYAGRKLLSRAFRNRFIELHFDEIPNEELEIILHKRCEMPPSYAKKIVTVMREIQLNRRETGCFNVSMTMRDLFRWGNRYLEFKMRQKDDIGVDWHLKVASLGLVLLEGRARSSTESDVIKSALERVFKCSLSYNQVYGEQKIDTAKLDLSFRHIKMTKEFNKLFFQLKEALDYREPVLLCGPTGCGKTTACQLFAALNRIELYTYNCHQNTESSDFVGGVRPKRDPEEAESRFIWNDGPLLEAMKNGGIFLMDEISLADDAVLERINSVLEPVRSITLTEKNGEEIHANEAFLLVATMNPGGDYGKKELSPALRNRFTEIYCHNTTDLSQIKSIIEGSLSRYLLRPDILVKLMAVMQRFLAEYYEHFDVISIRDILSWTNFINKTTNVKQPRPLSAQEALVYGADLVFFDQFGCCGHKSSTIAQSDKLKAKLRQSLVSTIVELFSSNPCHPEEIPSSVPVIDDLVVFDKFVLTKQAEPILESFKKEFVLECPSVKRNLIRIARAMILDRPILLEGDPGAGKTSIVTALAKLTGNKLVRINLSDQTDISDLFGSDLPCASTDSNDDKPKFAWHDGIMLKALQESSWILLDEMNLASQSVLEGLNACFDHRGEIFISELNRKFTVNRSKSRIFACQNPYSQGSARKGLPQSFVNRFTSIYINSYSMSDMQNIICSLHPNLPQELVAKMVKFNNELDSHGGLNEFEFNLRDMLHWCDLMTRYVRGDDFKDMNLHQPERFVQFVYLDRLRASVHRSDVSDIFERVFGVPVYEPLYRDIRLGEHSFILARSILPRHIRPAPHLPNLCILKYQLPYLESIAKAIEFGKMPILVGESGVGKRSMVRILAGLTGNRLSIIGANRDMDTLELLGSFEQRSVQRQIVELIEDAKECVKIIMNSVSQKKNPETWTQIFDHIWKTLYSTSIKDIKQSKREMMDSLRFQLIQMKEVIESMIPLTVYNSDKLCKPLLDKINRLVDKFARECDSITSSGNFEWIDSVLIKAIRSGSWIMIENANLMDPATLDRLNSLVEPNGQLVLNEKGYSTAGSGQEIETVVPHPNFRLILTMNPEYGELSRAMRNRGVEIFVQTKFYFEDYLMLLNQNGFEPEERKACMAYCIMQTCYDAHKRITGEDPAEDGSLLAYFGLNYIPILTHQVRRGAQIDAMLLKFLFAFYSQRGFAEECNDETLPTYILDNLNKYRKTYEVNFLDERYKWRHLRHDLISLTGGDAITAMLDRDNRIFFEDLNLESLFRPDELVENIDIVNTCITVKIFLELATHGDFDYRRGFISETFSSKELEKMRYAVNSHLKALQKEHIPLIKSLVQRNELMPISEMHIDSRNSPDIFYNLLSLDYKGCKLLEGHQNRWTLSLHRIMLSMIVQLTEERSMYKQDDGKTHDSLWSLSEKVREKKMNEEDLPHQTAAIVGDLFDLLNGLLLEVSNRCFSNHQVRDMLPKFFWISHFICKLKTAFPKERLVATCKEIPMMFALSYQKIIMPMIRDFDMVDQQCKFKKFSNRVKHICEFFDITVTKLNRDEKLYYNKVLNSYATTLRNSERVARDLDVFFSKLLGRHTAHVNWEERDDMLMASSFVWSNSSYMKAFYEICDSLLAADSIFVANPNDEQAAIMNLKHPRAQLKEKDIEYENYEKWFAEGKSNRNKWLNSNRRMNALDQFSPIWQMEFLCRWLSNSMSTDDMDNPSMLESTLKHTLASINGLLMSPKFYASLIKYLRTLQDRQQMSSNDGTIGDAQRVAKENADMYAAFLTDHLSEYVVLDNQVVGWTRLRVTTSDLSSEAPLIPEYAPLLSLVAGYCLDISHLKLNSYLSSSAQLDSVLIYLWHHYVTIKLNTNKNSHDFTLAKRLIHLRAKVDTMRSDMMKGYEHECKFQPADEQCVCIDKFIMSRVPSYEQLMAEVHRTVMPDEAQEITKAIKLIYFGYINYMEYEPIFSLDPSLRSSVKLDIYKAELAHIKLDLHLRNTLFYWKTGENLLLNEVDADEAASYPFSTRILIERRIKLERSIAKLSSVHSNWSRNNDTPDYEKLRQEIKVTSLHFSSVLTLVRDLNLYFCAKKTGQKQSKFENLVSMCRMIITNMQKSINTLRMEYSLFSDLTTNCLTGLCFVLQGLRCLYAKMEQQIQIQKLGFHGQSADQHMSSVSRLFFFNNFTSGNLRSVRSKLELLPQLARICPQEDAAQLRSLLLRTVLIQLNHHIIISPSDIESCMPIVRRIADRFHAAWLERKLLMEKAKREKEDLYRHKPSRNALGNEVSYEKQEFFDVCARFPFYDHIYDSFISSDLPSTVQENLKTEEKICNLNRSVDLTMCIDICKAHYKFIKEASRSLLSPTNTVDADSLPQLNLRQLSQLEAQSFYTTTRFLFQTLDRNFESNSLECHLLQANQLIKRLRQTETPNNRLPVGSLKNSIEILDEDIFDIYHNPNAFEALRFQEFIYKVEKKIKLLHTFGFYDNDSTLAEILRLTARISSFLINDPMMKFVTGSHLLLTKLDTWNKNNYPKEHKMVTEVDELIELIGSWRSLEVQSWRSSLHKVKRKYIDGRLCDLWFELYEAFSDPLAITKRKIESLISEERLPSDYVLTQEHEQFMYMLFMSYIKDFLESATLGDYQVRLDLVFSFAIQTRFDSLYEKKGKSMKRDESSDKLAQPKSSLKVDYEKLYTYVYNIHGQYQGLFEHLKEVVEKEEAALSKDLNTEIRIVNWQTSRDLIQIKENFRISHKKLNKVMNRYLEVLRRPLPKMTRSGNLSDKKTSGQDEDKALDTDKIDMTLRSIQLLVNDTKVPRVIQQNKLIILNKVKRITNKYKELHGSTSDLMITRYLENLVAIENTRDDISDAIERFHSHKVQSIVIQPRDSKETKNEKLKECRRMHHDKRGAMAFIFSALKNIGVSYKRGLVNIELLDSGVLSLEPLRGLIKRRSHLVLKASSKLVEDSIISECNEEYRTLIASNMNLLNQPRHEDLTGEQHERIRGYALDMVLDIINHNNSAAYIYRHLIDIQATTTQLAQLQSKLSTSSNNGNGNSNQVVAVHNFSQVQSCVKQFDDIVGRAYLIVLKLEELSDCYKTMKELLSLADSVVEPPQGLPREERTVLKDLICTNGGQDRCLMSVRQHEHFVLNVSSVRRSIVDISNKLRDMLNNQLRNHLYTSADLDQLANLYDKFVGQFASLLPNEEEDLYQNQNDSSIMALDDSSSEMVAKEPPANRRPGTVLGALKSLLDEAETQLRPKIKANQQLTKNVTPIDEHPNIDRLNVRLQKLVRAVTKATELVYKMESEMNSRHQMTDEQLMQLDSTKRIVQKPFKYVDSKQMRSLLRIERVAKHTGDCIQTLNQSAAVDIASIVEALTPVLSIYVQNVSCYLNIIITSLHLKLCTANRLLPFFTDLVIDGFGLPYKAPPETGDERMTGKQSEDNAGFGEGKGDNDVSKKLEFQSQLDDLKGNDGEGEKENEESVEAHDDGVEMSEDIDAKAEGADRSAKEDQNSNKSDEEEESDEALDELDKEMDSVDQDEGQLDEKLWGDMGELDEQEDDEKDLRDAEPKQEQASTEPNDKPENAEHEQETVGEQKGDSNEMGEKETEAGRKEDTEQQQDEEKSDQQENRDKGKDETSGEIDLTAEGEEQQPNEELDLTEEAEQARAEPPADTESTREAETEAMDMSVSDDMDESGQMQIDENHEEADKKSEGEVSGDEQQQDDEISDLKLDDDNSSTQTTGIDDDEIDNQLELARNPELDKSIDNPIEQMIRNLSSQMRDGQGSGQEDHLQQEMQHRRVGQKKIYETIPEDSNEPWFADRFADQLDEEQQKDNNTSRNNNRSQPHESGDMDDISDIGKQDEPEAKDVTFDFSDISDDMHSARDELEESTGDSDSKKSKRTFAEREEPEADSKRQKILPSSETEDTNKDKPQSSSSSKQVRHTDNAPSNAPEVVDLVTDSEDEQEVPKLKVAPSSDPVDPNAANSIMEQVDGEVDKMANAEMDSVDMDKLITLWGECTRRANHLVNELCQKLQIVLQPTKMSKYKGDYKKGKRLNMRKIISYIASHYRKDKIWMRRTKPSKRTYNITIAVDNSSSMSENNCRQMTYESLALVAKALTVIEAGSLSVVSFGQKVNCLHDFGLMYTSAAGAQWLRDLRFNENQTSYSQLLKYSCESFERQAKLSAGSSQLNGVVVNQLLVILSDGRSVSSEEEDIKLHLKKLKTMGVLTLFIIIDDIKKNSNNSIVSVQRCLGIGSSVKLVSYMELFPFPYYIILRELESMPTILGDSLRQWFELVSSGDRV